MFSKGGGYVSLILNPVYQDLYSIDEFVNVILFANRFLYLF